jgi:hypothetical protein
VIRIYFKKRKGVGLGFSSKIVPQDTVLRLQSRSTGPVGRAMKWQIPHEQRFLTAMVNRVELIWVSGHEGNVGNKNAD